MSRLIRRPTMAAIRNRRRLSPGAVEMVEEGADIIEVGAQSWRFGASRVSEAEEKRRLIPALKRMRGRLACPFEWKPARRRWPNRPLRWVRDPQGSNRIDPRTGAVQDRSESRLGACRPTYARTPDQWAKQAADQDPAGASVAGVERRRRTRISAGVPRTGL